MGETTKTSPTYRDPFSRCVRYPSNSIILGVRTKPSLETTEESSVPAQHAGRNIPISQ